MLKFVEKSLMKDIILPSLAPKFTRAGKGRALGQLRGPVALIALAWATAVVAPALAQGVPAGLLRLDPPPQPYGGELLAEDRRERALGAYARMPNGYERDASRFCMRFRSYDPATETYLGRDGNRRPCP